MRRDRLRQINACVAACMLVLFLLHGVGNAFMLMDAGAPTSKMLARATLTLAVVHAVLSMALSWQSIRTSRETGVSYLRLNKRFWTVRISGVACALFLVTHMLAFLQVGGGGAYRLHEFGDLQFASQIGLVVSLALHLLANLRPLMVSLGIPSPRARALDVGFVLSVLLLVMAASFVVYYLRWSVI
ncbi:MAG: hypothetical protein Q4B54_02420 [Coriobacteriales bacterium]|nr:hypothetical protein [Coriobacteriales bacterium]